jgi:uncharacterized protein YkwD
MAGVVTLAATACLPDTQAGGPADPTLAGVYQAVNSDRAANGLPALTWSPKLANLAQGWAQQMAGTGTLYHRDLSALVGRGDFSAYWTMGENILVGPGNMTPAQMEAMWMGSPDHRSKILSGNFNVVGAGAVHGPDGRLWAVLDFGGI